MGPHIPGKAGIGVMLAGACLAGLALGTAPSCRRGGQAHPAAAAYPPRVYPYQPDPRFVAGLPLRPMDTDILALLARGAPERGLSDLFPDRPYRVQLVVNEVDHRIDFVAIDLDRDGRWDERWRLKPDTVDRQTLSAKPGGDIPFALRNGRWMPY